MISRSRAEMILKKYRIHILIFFIAFFIFSALTLPKLYLTDEWITLNQLAQIDQGHQVIFNEGKYGSFENGTPSKYFEEKGNRLAYTIFLPLLALPTIKCIHIFGDFFLYLFLVIWVTILIFIAFFLNRFFPELSNKNTLSVSNFLIFFAFILFFVNLVIFRSFPFSDSRMPVEVAAIGFTNLILLSALAVILYATFLTIFQDPRISVMGMVITICCSSYIFWATTAKDHLLVAFLFGLLIYLGIKYIYTHDFWYLPLFFIIIGLIAWARAEFAVPLFGIFCIIAGIKGVIVILKEPHLKTGLILLLSPLFTLVGAVPFFINNFLISGNSLIPPNTFYDMNLMGNSGGTEIGTSLSSINHSPDTNAIIHQTGIFSLIDRVLFYYTPHPGSIIMDLIRMFFLPSNFATAIVVISPVLLLGILFMVFSRSDDKKFSDREKHLACFLGIISVIIVIAYIHSWNGMSYSFGIRPDIRYLSPLYLPFGILGVFLIQKCGMLPIISKKELPIIIGSSFAIISVLIALSLFFNPSDLSTIRFLLIVTATTTCIMYALVVFCSLCFIFMKNPQVKKEYCMLLLLAIIITPFVWQIAMIFVSNIINGPEGYRYWIPAMKEIMYRLQDFVVGST